MSDQIRPAGRDGLGPRRRPFMPAAPVGGNGYARYVPWIFVTLAAVYLLLVMVPPEEGDKELHLYQCGQIPVVADGRVKPLDTVARNTLLGISDRQTWRDKKGNVRPAIEWLLDVMTVELSKDRSAEEHPVFRIENDQLLEILKLEQRSGLRYSIAEMAPQMAELDDKAARAVRKEQADRDLLDRKVLELRRSLEKYLELSRWHEPHLVPPRQAGDQWQPFLQAVAHEKTTGREDPNVQSLGNILLAYARKDTAKFNAEVDSYLKRLEKERPDDVRQARFEAFFNHFEPFFQCSVLYLFVAVMTCIGWLIWREPLRQSAFWLTVLTLVVHTGALLARMYISGRPPVTNLYSSAVFIGWAVVILGLIMEHLWPLSIGNLVASVGGSITVLIAHSLATSGDTMAVLQAVLDTNFWLATHVTCITLGYAATYVAGLVGMIFILLGVATPHLNRDLWKALGQAIYGITCFAMFLSFTGTVLGGIWADQSWGRFWGWDPKENGALLIVLINAILLHARWGGMVQQRGMAVLSVVGNIVTTWSWFGVNMLGVGLHSYGFMDGAVLAMAAAIGTFLTFVVMGLVPLRYWRSFQPLSEATPRAQRRPEPELVR